MKNLLNPKWLFLINTLPVVVLFLIFYGQYQLIETLLPEKSFQLWKIFGWILFSLSCIHFFYAIFLVVKDKKTSLLYGFVSLLCYVPFVYLYHYFYDDLVPSSIPRWMTPDGLFLYVGTFLMPTMAHAVLVLVLKFTQKIEKANAWKSFAFAILIPVVWYLFFNIILPLWRHTDALFFDHFSVVLTIVFTIVFMFFFIKGIYILTIRNLKFWKTYALPVKIIFTIFLPVFALSINNGFLFSSTLSSDGILGDFSHYSFYVLAVLNGILLTLPNPKKKKVRLLLFIGRSIFLCFMLYFFMVALPFLPLSILVIVFFGFGFLILLPVVLFVFQIHVLSKDFNFLASFYSKRILWVIGFAGFLVLPILITIKYQQDKSTLHTALAYLYTPDYSKEVQIDKKSLGKTLDLIKSQKDSQFFIFTRQQPYLTPYFNWLVLDNLTLSDSKINRIETVFFREPSFGIQYDNIQDTYVKLSNIATRSEYDASQNAWKSWIDLEITNESSDRRAEYGTTFELPVGAWISDYYLYVGDRKEMGLLAEKRSAMWVFSNIRNENRDPGILYYLTGNKVAFRVFPFAEREVRRTGIEILHKEPIQLEFDRQVLSLGDSIQQSETMEESAHATYISATEKERLKRVVRKPYFHFIVNSSGTDSVSAIKYQTQQLVEQYPELALNAKISLTNSYVKTLHFKDDWATAFTKHEKLGGGFFVERAIQHILFESYKEASDSYPVIMVISGNFSEVILEKDFADWSFAYPELPYFFIRNQDGYVETHSLQSNSRYTLKDDIDFSQQTSVFEYPLKNTVQYLADDGKPSILLKEDSFDLTDAESKEKNWHTGLDLQAQWQSQILHPETSNQRWLPLVKNSFVSKIMSPVTSYIVVETEAQKAALLKKQEDVLKGNKSLDLNEDTHRMSEPSWWILLLGFVGFLWYQKKRKHPLRSK